MPDLDSKAAEMFAEGKSTNRVAAALYKNNRGRAKKQRALWQEAQGEVAPSRADEAEEKEPEGEEAGEAEAEGETLVLNLDLPTVHLDRAIENIADDELRAATMLLENVDKANLFQIVLQQRLTKILEAEN